MESDIYAYMQASRKLSAMDLSFSVEHLHLNLKSCWCKVGFYGPEKLKVKLHSHWYWELFFVMAGSCFVILPEGTVYVEKGNYLLLPPGIEHALENISDDMAAFVWNVDITENDQPLTGLDQFTVRPYPASNVLYRLVFTLLEEAKEQLSCQYALIHSCLYSIYLLIWVDQRSDLTRLSERQIDPRAFTARKFIEDNLASSPSNAEIAAQCGLSERQLNRIVLTAWGISLGELRRNIQIHTVRKLLAETDISLAEIAALTGFCDEFAMNKAFKKSLWISPGKYRQLRQNVNRPKNT